MSLGCTYTDSATTSLANRLDMCALCVLTLRRIKVPTSESIRLALGHGDGLRSEVLRSKHRDK